MSDLELISSPSPSPPAPHCDYSDWSPTFSIIPFVYLLAFVVGCLGNTLVLWAYLDRAEGRKNRTGCRTGTGARTGLVCCSENFRVSGRFLNGTSQKKNDGTPQCPTRQSYRASSQSSSSSAPSSLPRSSRSLTDSLIASLALADLCFLVTLPLWAVYTAMGYHWPFGQPLCQISSFLTALNMYASVFSLSMLSVERYWVLTGRRHSSHHAQQGCYSRVLWVVGGVWVLAGILAFPGLLLRSVREVEQEAGPEDDWEQETGPEDDWELEPTQPANPGAFLLSCQMDYSILIGAELDEEERDRAELWWAAALSLKSTLIGFLLPLVILLVCYCSLARLLSRHFGRGPRPDRKRQRRLLRVIITLVLAFFLCWLPLHVNKTLAMLLEFSLIPYSCSIDQTLLAAQPYVTCLAYLNSCLNPLLYAACDSSFRRKCRGVLLLIWRSWKRREDGEEGEREVGGEERGERSSAFQTRTQEETADRTVEERMDGVREGGMNEEDEEEVQAGGIDGDRERH